MSDPSKDPKPATGKRALESARLAAKGFRPDLTPDTPEYAAFIDFALKLYRVWGRHVFELNFGLRPPRGRMEEICRDRFAQKISDDEAKARIKAYAAQPVDLEMLTLFHEVATERVERYSNILRRVIPRPSRSAPEDLIAQERYIDAQVRALRQKSPMDSRNMLTVLEFLEDFCVRSGKGLVVLDKYEAVSAHWLAELVTEHIVKSWQSSKSIATRSQTDRRYTYVARAADLFFESSFPNFPAPQRILERLRHEFILARAELAGQPPSPPIVTPPLQPSVEAGTGREDRCEILVGEFTAIVARAGHIFREVLKGDEGIDGEIEFKDDKGQATGKRIYVQLKSGDSHLQLRKKDQCEIFTVKKQRHLVYWQLHAYPVMLVIRQSSGRTRWMNISSYLRQNPLNPRVPFQGDEVTIDAIQRLASQSMGG